MPRTYGSVETQLATLTRPDGELMRFIRRRVDDPNDVEDIKQVTCTRFVRLWDESPAPIENPVAFIIRIAEKVIFEHWRAIGYQRSLFDLSATREAAEDVQDGGDGPEDIENRRREEQLLREGLETALTPLQRAVLLRRLTGVSVAEAGLAFGLSQHQAERILHDARESLREFIRSKEGSKR